MIAKWDECPAIDREGTRAPGFGLAFLPVIFDPAPTMVKRVFLLVLLLLAQARAVELRFLSIDFGATEQRDFYLADPDRKTAEPLSLHGTGRAVPVNPVKGSFLLRVITRGDSAAKPVEFPVKVDPAIRKGLVVLIADARSRAKVRGVTFEYDPATFAKGSYRLLNASNREWTIDLGGQRALLPANHKPVDIKPAGEKFAPVAISTLQEPAKPRLTSLWKLTEDRCQLMVLTPGKADKDPPGVRGIELLAP